MVRVAAEPRRADPMRAGTATAPASTWRRVRLICFSLFPRPAETFRDIARLTHSACLFAMRSTPTLDCAAQETGPRNPERRRAAPSSATSSRVLERVMLDKTTRAAKALAGNRPAQLTIRRIDAIPVAL